jgi:predicted  nucleic acid-binding Zn-ribbon protein
MAVTTAALRELHRIHRQLTDLRERRDNGPKQVAAREVNVAKLLTEVDAARELSQQMRMTVDRKQLDLKSGEQKIVDLRAKLNTAASNKEYQTLLEQIAAAEMANSVLSDEILEGFDKSDELETAAKVAVQEAAASIEADVVRLEGELAGAESSLPSEFRADYQRIVRSKGAEGLAVVEDSVCTGCGQQITLNMLNDLQLSRLVFCKSCGCLLYLTEE